MRLRKLIVISTWLLAQTVWVFLGLIPLFVDVPSGSAVAMLMVLMAVRSSVIAIMGPAWNSWIRDVVPREGMGRFFSRRLALSTIASIAFGPGGAFFVDWWGTQAFPEDVVFGYSFVLIFGAAFLGLTSVLVMFPMSEPRMQTVPGPQPSILKTLGAPLRDKNYTHLMRFLLFWGFASTLATPFFVVYMLTRLGLPVSVAIGFTVLGQVFNVLFLRVWGPFADRYGYKVVLSLSA